LPTVGGPQSDSAWTLGIPALDQHLGRGLEAASLHEVKALPRAAGVTASDWAAVLGFALRLAVRRLESFAASSADPPRVLWCWPSVFARELGAPYGPGLAALGIEPSSWLFVETARASDTLWAMEEGLHSQSLALVIGVLSEAELTPARRLSLVAAEHSTPCLIVTDPRLSPAGSTATRWRVGACSSAMHSFNALAPGAPRYAVALERCRHRPLTHEHRPVLLEWSDETHRFRMAAAVADRTHAPRPASAHSG
jgi:protein ImuA